jgi:diacylglycerol kinase family enzyme
VAAKLCVIYNPNAGRGRGAERMTALRRLLGERAEFRSTAESGQAEAFALEAARSGFAVVVAAGGDGTVHEVANGVLRAERPEVAVAVFPMGSANDYAHCLATGSAWSAGRVPGQEGSRVDVGRVSAPGRQARYFVNGLGLGLNGAVTLESRRIRRLQGLPLYSLALVRALWHRYTCPRMTITLDGEPRTGPTLALTVALGRREGNFLLAPDAVLDDGRFDYLHAGSLRRWELLRFLPRMISGRLPKSHPAISFGRCKEVRVESDAALAIHADGELFSVPEDGIRDVEIRMLPGALRVLTGAV